jgi:hypothetical protein
MIESAKDAARKWSIRTSLTLNATLIVLLAFSYLAVHTGHARADIQLDGWSIGGGTEEHAAREQQLAALSAAIPSTAVTPPPVRVPVVSADGPLPSRKPVR